MYKRLLAGFCMSVAMSGVLASTFVSSASAAPASAVAKAATVTKAVAKAPCQTAAKAALVKDSDGATVLVVSHKSQIPADFQLTSAKSVNGVASPNFVLNPCAEIDLSQIVDCRSGTCYEYCWNRIQPYSRVYCADDKKYYSRKNWIKYVSGHRGNDCVPGS